jgi:outer membrane protein assembly factor BamB
MWQARIGWRGATIAASLLLLAAGLAGACGGSKASGGVGAGSGAGASSSSGEGPTSSSGTSSGAMAGDSVLMHHKNPSRDGVYVQPALTKAAVATLHKDTSFAPTGIQGQVYAQPLFVDGGAGGKDMVIVATGANNVYALDAATGATLWTKNVGASVPLANLPCGNVDPFGINGTPVIDFATRTLYLDAEVLSGGSNTHDVFALSIDDGSIKAGWPVDMAAKAKSGSTTFQPNPQSQRGALALFGGTLYIPFGGRYGDCGNYHGWVVAISTTDPTNVQAWATSAQGGGSWAPNGVSTDRTNLFMTTGNTINAGGNWGGGEAVIRLTPGASLAMNAYFAPKNWQALDNGDADLGTGPVIFDLAGSTPSALTFVFGKDGNGYLLDRNNLGGVSDPLGVAKVSGGAIISAPVVYSTATATYVATRGNGSACTTGSGDLLTVKIMPGSPPTIAKSWCAAGGAGSPMVTTSDGHADAIVWTLGAEADGHLHAFDGDTGTAIAFTDAKVNIPGMRKFNTPIAAKGRIFVPVDGGIVAFKP